MRARAVTIVTPGYTEDDGLDRVYVHGAQIRDPENDVNVTWDLSGTAAPVYVLAVEPAEDDAPYVAAIGALGIIVTGRTEDGWVGIQTREL